MTQKLDSDQLAIIAECPRIRVSVTCVHSENDIGKPVYGDGLFGAMSLIQSPTNRFVGFVVGLVPGNRTPGECIMAIEATGDVTRTWRLRPGTG